MSHFAKVENGIVTQVIVADQEFIDSAVLGHGWIQTSYNTCGNVHYGSDGQPDGGVALNKNYAGVGYTYDPIDDAFIAPMPDCGHDTLLLNTQKRWECADCEATFKSLSDPA
jgi:hypothetical protein